jgi:glucose dehydrogenase
MTPAMFKADRNGFFYVLNRKTGQLISAKSFVPDQLGNGVDMATGRPIEVADKRPRFKFRPMDICPNLLGGKNWQPMSYNPQTGPRLHPVHQPVHGHGGAEPAYKRGTSTSRSSSTSARAGPAAT